jgi:predicted glycosyltransferase
MALRILVAPVNWGLGHATRCIPLIRELAGRGFDVSLGSDGLALELLRKEFPQLACFELPAYNIRYHVGGSLSLKLLLQSYRVLRAMKHEENWLKQNAVHGRWQAIISDGRFGLWSREIFSVIISHQINFMMPGGFGWISPLVNGINHARLRKFHRIWIPDEPGEANLAGLLSHTGCFPEKSRFIGIQSRLKKPAEAEIRWELLVLLSGPEPQRTVLEKIIAAQLALFSPGRVLFIRGTNAGSLSVSNRLVEIRNLATSSEISEAMESAACVLSRSGYSTVMDLVSAGRRAILIPTPGQTEQEYLAAYLSKRKMFCSVVQKKLNLAHAFSHAMELSHPVFRQSDNLLSGALDELENDVLSGDLRN